MKLHQLALAFFAATSTTNQYVVHCNAQAVVSETNTKKYDIIQHLPPSTMEANLDNSNVSGFCISRII